MTGGGGRRKWSGSQGCQWKISWAEGGTFKIDQEGGGLTDRSMEEWGGWMDAQIEKKFGESHPPLTASTLNFSRNELGDDGIKSLVEYLLRKRIAVITLKLFRNGISDAGAYAMGQLLAHCREPVHEVHLSHNRVTEKGALQIMQDVAGCKRYPYNAERSGRRDAKGITPIWLRMEYNCIEWAKIDAQLEQRQIRWCAAESRDGWTMIGDTTPTVCMHASYQNQKLEPAPVGAVTQTDRPRGGVKPAWFDEGGVQHDDDAFLASISAQTHQHHNNGRRKEEEYLNGLGIGANGANGALDGSGDDEEGATDEVPMYVFLDASAVHRMMSREDSIFTFQGLLNLCQMGKMMCTPTEDQPSLLGHVEEKDRIVLAITDEALEDLSRCSADWRRLEWLRNAPDSYLHLCHQWGFLEILETKMHTQLMKLTRHQRQEAQRLKITQRTLKTFDFACLWESQIDSAGRVLFLTADPALKEFGDGLAAADGGKSRHVRVVLADELEKRFAADTVHGGAKLSAVALSPRNTKNCKAVLSAQLLSDIAFGATPSSTSRSTETDLLREEANKLRKELRDAVALVESASSLFEEQRRQSGGGRPGGGGAAEVNRLLERMGDASRRWQTILSKGRQLQ